MKEHTEYPYFFCPNCQLEIDVQMVEKHCHSPARLEVICPECDKEMTISITKWIEIIT